MSTIIGANHPKHCAPGGFTKRKRRTRDLYREAKSVRDCAIKFLESRGITGRTATTGKV